VLNKFYFLAAVPDQVPNFMIDSNSVTFNGDAISFTLSWGEPFNNFDPVVNYTVSCSGDAQCPPDFTTIDNTTRSYNLANLNSMTNYTFIVVATNSLGDGEPVTLDTSGLSGR